MKTLQKIFEQIGTTNKFAVEFGCHTTHQGSICMPFKKKGWTVQFYGIESGGDLIHEFITAENVNEIFKKNNVPHDLDLMSIDIDGMDYWVWKALEFEPRVLVIEYNRRRPKGVQPYFAFNMWNLREDSYYGASKVELLKLGKEKGYKLISENEDNLFFQKGEENES